MAMSSDKKLYLAVGVLAVLGGALYFQKQSAAADRKAYTYESLAAELPSLSISEEDTNAITRIVLEQPAKEGDDAAPARKHVLVKEGDTWRLDEPLKASANQANVESLLKNLHNLKVKERLANENLEAAYAQYDLTEEKGVHATFFAGDDKKYDFWFGKGGARGQTARWEGASGVYVVDGYSSFLYTRDTKGWRDLSIFKFDSDNVMTVTIENEHGSFEFNKDGVEWSGKFKKAKSAAAAAIKDFEKSKVDDLLRAYKSLNATDFGDDKKPEDVGLDTPTAKIRFQLEDGAQRQLIFGSNAEGSTRWAQVPDKEAIYTISSWAADWAFAEESKFQKKDDDGDHDDH